MLARTRSVLLSVLLLGALAGAPAAAAGADGVPFPMVPEAKGGECVEDPEVMRRNHMDFLKHQRDETMRRGIRTQQFSLKGCIDCHAVTDAAGEPVGIESEEHFCRVCHDYAAVKLDCFSCHASRPDEVDAAGQQAAR